VEPRCVAHCFFFLHHHVFFKFLNLLFAENMSLHQRILLNRMIVLGFLFLLGMQLWSWILTRVKLLPTNFLRSFCVFLLLWTSQLRKMHWLLLLLSMTFLYEQALIVLIRVFLSQQWAAFLCKFLDSWTLYSDSLESTLRTKSLIGALQLDQRISGSPLLGRVRP